MDPQQLHFEATQAQGEGQGQAQAQAQAQAQPQAQTEAQAQVFLTPHANLVFWGVHNLICNLKDHIFLHVRQEKTSNLIDMASNAAQSAKETMQEVPISEHITHV